MLKNTIISNERIWRIRFSLYLIVCLLSNFLFYIEKLEASDLHVNYPIDPYFLIDNKFPLSFCETNTHQSLSRNIHTGIDISVPANVPVYSLCAGEVVHDNTSANYWNSFLILKHQCEGQQFFAYYGHVISNYKNAKFISAGEQIAVIRKDITGQFGDHLHLSITVSSDWDRYGWGYASSCEDALKEGYKNPSTYLKFSYPPDSISVKIPYEDDGACPFEGCIYRGWIARKDTIIREDRNRNSPANFTAKSGERVQALTGIVVINKPGIAKIVKPIQIGTVFAGAGDLIFILTPRGEGFAKVWYKGQLDVIDIDGSVNPKFQSALDFISRSEYTWWIKIRNDRGLIGWTNEPENFDNKDLFGLIYNSLISLGLDTRSLLR